MGTIVELAQERTDLQPEEIDRLLRVIEAWNLIADLSLSDLVLWLPTWNDGGVIAAALVRPTTASTTVEEDLVGRFGFTCEQEKPGVKISLLVGFSRNCGSARRMG